MIRVIRDLLQHLDPCTSMVHTLWDSLIKVNGEGARTLQLFLSLEPMQGWDKRLLWCNKYLFCLFISWMLHLISIFHPKEIWEMFCFPIRTPKIFLIWPLCSAPPWDIKSLYIMEETSALTSREESFEEKKVRVGISDLNVYQKANIIPLMLVVSNCMANLGFVKHLSKSVHSFICQAQRSV